MTTAERKREAWPIVQTTAVFSRDEARPGPLVTAAGRPRGGGWTRQPPPAPRRDRGVGGVEVMRPGQPHDANARRARERGAGRVVFVGAGQAESRHSELANG